MTRAHLTAALTIVTALGTTILGGCSVPDLNPGSSPAPSDAAQHTPTPSPAADGVAACATFFEADLLKRIPAVLTSIGETLDDEALTELLDVNETLAEAIDLAPTEVAAPLTSLQEPFQQVEDAVDAGGGSLNLDTSHVMVDVTDLMEQCAAAGYTLDQ